VGDPLAAARGPRPRQLRVAPDQTSIPLLRAGTAHPRPSLVPVVKRRPTHTSSRRSRIAARVGGVPSHRTIKWSDHRPSHHPPPRVSPASSSTVTRWAVCPFEVGQKTRMRSPWRSAHRSS